MGGMLAEGFKDNKALKRGILTGIMKVAKESIFRYLSMPSDDFMSYWINTSSNEMIKEVLQLINQKVKKLSKNREFG